MSIWLWIIIIIVGLAFLGYILDWGREKGLKKDLAHLQEFVETRNTSKLLRMLSLSKSTSDHAQLLNALGQLKDPDTIPYLLTYYQSGFVPEADFVKVAEILEPAAKALAAMPADQVVPQILEKFGGKTDFPLIDLLRRFDYPAALQAVANHEAAYQLERQMTMDRRAVVEALLKEAGQPLSTKVLIALQSLNTPGVGAKVVGGLLSGGVEAVKVKKVDLDDAVRLPKECAFCGIYPGVKERVAKTTFQTASAAWGIVGVNPTAEAFLTYRVCDFCVEAEKRACALAFFMQQDAQKAWHIELFVRNPAVADRIREINPSPPAVPETGKA